MFDNIFSSTVFEPFGRPIAWSRNLWELDTENEDNNGLKNEDLIVWMRTAALPSFRKLYRRVNFEKEPKFQGKLPRGNYELDIEYSKSSLRLCYANLPNKLSSIRLSGDPVRGNKTLHSVDDFDSWR